MSKRLVATAVLSLATIACDGDPLLSPRSSWGSDFTDRSPPTGACLGGALTQLRTRMAVSEPHSLATFRQDVPESVRAQISADDTLRTFQFSTDPATGNFWGFSGYLVSRGDCIVHAKVTGHDN
jgi:hypothetical protein